MLEKALTTSGYSRAVLSTRLAILFASSKDTLGSKKDFTSRAPSSSSGANSVPVLDTKKTEMTNPTSVVPMSTHLILNALSRSFIYPSLIFLKRYVSSLPGLRR